MEGKQELNELVTSLSQQFKIKKILELIETGSSFGVRHLHGSSKSWFIYLLRSSLLNRRIVIIVPEENSLNKFNLDLQSFFGIKNVFPITSRSISKYRQIPNEKLELNIYEKLIQFHKYNDSILILTPE
ncbi:MAG: hypothetical protein ACK4SO_00885, partial [Candidatus Kapaibacteriota bacterium]